MPGFYGRTVLWDAAYHGHVKVVQRLEISRLLIGKGAHAITPSKFGHTPLHAAANTGNEEFSENILDRGWNSLAIFHDGRNPFLLAVLCDNIKIVDMLDEKGYDGSKLPDQRGYACIHAAAEYGNLGTLQKLRALETEPLTHTIPGFNAVYFAACKG